MDSFQRESLPPDMIFEIIARTSLEALDTCKAVSKEWKQLISTSAFLASYSKTTGNLVGYMVQSLVSNKYLHKFVSPNESAERRSFNFSPFKSDDIKIESSSPQGILCCFRNIGKDGRYYVSKPCTNQWQALPNPKCPHSTEKVALVVMSSNPLRYKIFRLSRPRVSRLDCYNYQCQIFDSRTWAWKGAQDVLLSQENKFDNNPAVHAGGLVCFPTNDYILAFCIDQETPFTISLPESVCDDCHGKKIVEYQGKLGLICETSGNVELWVLKGWENRRWEMIKRLNTDVLVKETSCLSPAGFFNSELALMKIYRGLLFWDLQDFNSKEFHLQDLDARDIFRFCSDWKPVNLRQENFPFPVKPTRTDMAAAAENSSKSRQNLMAFGPF